MFPLKRWTKIEKIFQTLYTFCCRFSKDNLKLLQSYILTNHKLFLYTFKETFPIYSIVSTIVFYLLSLSPRVSNVNKQLAVEISKEDLFVLRMENQDREIAMHS